MRETLARMLELEREGRRFVVATVVRTQGSTPQVVGARLIVDDLGRLSGTLGGGCVEGDAIAEARRRLAEGGSSLRAYELTEPLAWDTGLVCGGTMWIHIESDRDALAPEFIERLASSLKDGGDRPVAFATRLRVTGRQVEADGHSVIERGDGHELGGGPLAGRARDVMIDAFERGVPRVVPVAAGREVLLEPVVPRPRLVIAGGGHVALAIAEIGRQLDYAITVIDDREDFANAQRFPGAEIHMGEIAPTLAGLDVGWNSFIVVATRGHKMDAHCLRAAVATRARYVGLLGSRRKTILIEKMLREEGVSEERLRAVHAPIGLDLGGRTPAEIALSVLAEMSRERFGGTGEPLRDAPQSKGA
jgi:xanthine dehydrogenase accessory factor